MSRVILAIIVTFVFTVAFVAKWQGTGAEDVAFAAGYGGMIALMVYLLLDVIRRAVEAWRGR